MSEKKAKGKSIFETDKLKNHTSEGKRKEKKRGGRKEPGEEKKKAMVELLVFILATLEIVFGRKTAEAIGGALFNNSVRYIFKTLYWPAP